MRNYKKLEENIIPNQIMQSQTHFAYLKKAHEITRSLESKTGNNRSRLN